MPKNKQVSNDEAFVGNLNFPIKKTTRDSIESLKKSMGAKTQGEVVEQAIAIVQGIVNNAAAFKPR